MPLSRGLWRTVFDAFDQNHNGRIDADELSAALASLGDQWSHQRVSDLLASYDADARGELSFDQFLALVRNAPPLADPELVRAFRGLDLDGDGCISANDLKALFSTAGVELDSDIDAFIAEGDSSGGGCVSFEKFLGLAAAKE